MAKNSLRAVSESEPRRLLLLPACHSTHHLSARTRLSAFSCRCVWTLCAPRFRVDDMRALDEVTGTVELDICVYLRWFDPSLINISR